MTIAIHQADRIKAIWDEHLDVAKSLAGLTSIVSQAVDLIAASLEKGGLLLVGGNGGSAADAQHIAAELTGRFLRERQPLRALALHGNTSSLTAIGNDYGYDRVFARDERKYVLMLRTVLFKITHQWHDTMTPFR